MPGPALNPVANTAPVAPAKAAAGARPDTPETGEAAAPEQGFASELKRQMRSDAHSEDDAEAQAAARDEAARDAAGAQAAQTPSAQLSPELAALLAAGTLPPTPAPPRVEPPATDASVMTAQPASPDGKLADLAAAFTGEAANTATPADPSCLAATSAAGKSVGDAAQALTETGTTPGAGSGQPDAAAPTNNFAAIHAAALANLRGEAAQPASAPAQLHVATPAGAPGWPEEVGNRVSWMVGHAESHAELTLTPPQLGRVEVSITVAGDQTSAQIVAASAAARDLIEQSLPRLREILEQSGITLGQADVGTSGQPGNPGEGRRGGNWNRAGNTADGTLAAGGSGTWLRRAEGLVDTFA